MNNRLEYNARKLTLSEDIVQQRDRNYPITKFIGKIGIKISFIMFLMFLFLFVNCCTTGKIFSINENLDDILMGVGSFAIFILVQIGYDFVKEKEVVDDTLLLIISSIGCVTMMIFYWTVLQCCGVPAFKNVFMTLNFIVVFAVPFIVTWAIVDIIIIRLYAKFDNKRKYSPKIDDRMEAIITISSFVISIFVYIPELVFLILLWMRLSNSYMMYAIPPVLIISSLLAVYMDE